VTKFVELLIQSRLSISVEDGLTLVVP